LSSNARRTSRSHTSYNKDTTVTLCTSCHHKVHDKTEVLSELEPEGSRYTVNTEVDKSKIPDKRGWSKVIQKNSCGKKNCAECPHGLYYYYVRRDGEEVEWEYGGRVEDSMLIQQKEIVDYVGGASA